MGLDDFLEPEVAVAAAITAAIFSPRVRKWMRRGLVFGTAGVLIASDTVTSFAKNIGEGVRQVGASMTQSEAQQTSHEG